MLISGLWVDAALPAPFGLFTCGFLLMGTLIAMARIRFRAEHNYHPILLAHAANFCCIVLLTISQGLPHYQLARLLAAGMTHDTALPRSSTDGRALVF